jgi:hypothetical protein
MKLERVKSMTIGKSGVYFIRHTHLLKKFDFAQKSNYYFLKIFKIEGQDKFF